MTDAPITRDEVIARRHGPAHVVGAASAEGVAVARLLVRLGFERIVLHDMRERAELRKAFRTTHGAWSRSEQDELWDGEVRALLDHGCFGERYLEGIAAGDGPTTVVLGQGWYLDDANRDRIVAAVSADALVTSMTALYLALAPGPIAGITGTNGKSTTVALVEHMLLQARVIHACAGNERSSRQFLPEVDELEAGTWSLLEISNRQLLQAWRSPDVAAITSLTPDHLEEHGGMAGYEDAKSRLFIGQDAASGIAIANADDPRALAVAMRSPAAPQRLVRCGIGGTGEGPTVSWLGDELVARQVPIHGGDVLAGPVVLARRVDVRMPGDHNRRNAAIACAVALACGVQADAVGPALRSFAGKSLRLEHIADIDGVEVWSDIKATTPEATVAALDALAGDRAVELIVGGDDKGLDYGPLAAAIIATGAGVHAVPGSATDALVAQMEARGAVGLVLVETLEQALDGALARACSGAAVIVSPAAAGFWTSQLQGGNSLRALVRRRLAANA